MGRFLLFIAYVGNNYRGLQLQTVAGKQRTDFKTVCGVLENCLILMRPQNEVKIVTSSRTDTNVHALCNSVHVDLVHRNPEKEFEERPLTVALNRMLSRNKELIRVLKTCRVNDDFHSRYQARYRSYIYHLAICRNDNKSGLVQLMPLEINRTYHKIHQSVFDFDKFMETAEMLSGTHYFNAFTTPSALEGRTRDPVRTVDVTVKRGSAFMEEYRPQVSESFEFWEIHIKSSSFLYRMVRRMVGVMISVAQGKQKLEDIQKALSDPTYAVPSPGTMTVPAYALYLKNVQYHPEDLQYNPQNSSVDMTTLRRKEVMPVHQCSKELIVTDHCSKGLIHRD